MRLPPDYELTTLSELRAKLDDLALNDNTDGITMTEEQYSRYKELVFYSDPIRRFEGRLIKISTPGESTGGDGSA